MTKKNKIQNHQSLPLYIEQKLKQIILKDLIFPDGNDLLKTHAVSMVSQAKNQILQENLTRLLSSQLIIACYAYHWGCCNLGSLPSYNHDNKLNHLPICFKNSAQKLERFLIYNFPKLFSQSQLLVLIEAIENQHKKREDLSELSLMLHDVASSVKN